jgi:DNA-binding CsgD family transcriptional regulator
MDDWSRLFASHPLIRWFGCTGDLSAMTMERVPDHIAGHRAVDVVRDGLPPLLGQQLSLPYRHTGTAHRGFLLSKAGRDFPDEDLVLARRIQPLLSLLARQWVVLERRGPGAGGGTAGRPFSAGDHADLALTGRQLAVLQLLAEGCTAVTIGRRLGISPRTVEVHLCRLYRKLDVHDRLMAVLAPREQGLIPPPDPVGAPHTVTPVEHLDQARRHSAPSPPLSVAAWRPDIGQCHGLGTLW